MTVAVGAGREACVGIRLNSKDYNKFQNRRYSFWCLWSVSFSFCLPSFSEKTTLLYAAQHNLFKGNYQICSCERAVLNIKLTARELGEIYSQIQQIDFHWENGRVAPRSHVFAVPINVETQWWCQHNMLQIYSKNTYNKYLKGSKPEKYDFNTSYTH